jgi:hypothetical protein
MAEKGEGVIPTGGEAEWRDLLVSHRGTDIPVEKRIPPLRCASVGMTTPFGKVGMATPFGQDTWKAEYVDTL